MTVQVRGNDGAGGVASKGVLVVDGSAPWPPGLPSPYPSPAEGRLHNRATCDSMFS